MDVAPPPAAHAAANVALQRIFGDEAAQYLIQFTSPIASEGRDDDARYHDLVVHFIMSATLRCHACDLADVRTVVSWCMALSKVRPWSLSGKCITCLFCNKGDSNVTRCPGHGAILSTPMHAVCSAYAGDVDERMLDVAKWLVATYPECGPMMAASQLRDQVRRCAHASLHVCACEQCYVWLLYAQTGCEHVPVCCCCSVAGRHSTQRASTATCSSRSTLWMMSTLTQTRPTECVH